MTINAYQARGCAEASSTLEFFATSIAALAYGEADPKQILDNVLDHLNLDRSVLLKEQAAKSGYASTDKYEAALIENIARQMADLKYCQLTAAQREQRRLIASL